MNSASLRVVEGAGFEPAYAIKPIQKNRTKALDLSTILPCGAHPTPVTKKFLTLIIWCVVLGGGLEPPLHFADLFCYRLSGHYHYTIRGGGAAQAPIIKTHQKWANLLLYACAFLYASLAPSLYSPYKRSPTSHKPLHTLPLCHSQPSGALYIASVSYLFVFFFVS